MAGQRPARSTRDSDFSFRGCSIPSVVAPATEPTDFERFGVVSVSTVRLTHPGAFFTGRGSDQYVCSNGPSYGCAGVSRKSSAFWMTLFPSLVQQSQSFGMIGFPSLLPCPNFFRVLRSPLLEVRKQTGDTTGFPTSWTIQEVEVLAVKRLDDATLGTLLVHQAHTPGVSPERWRPCQGILAASIAGEGVAR